MFYCNATMLLTLNQVLFIILTFLAVALVVYLVLFLNQLRRTVREGEKTLIKAQEVLEGFKEIEVKLNSNLNDIGEIVSQTRKVATGISEASLFLTTKVLRPTSKYWPLLIPLLRFGWQLMKKRKEKRNVK